MRVRLHNPQPNPLVLGDPFGGEGETLLVLRAGETIELDAPDDLFSTRPEDCPREEVWSRLTEDEMPILLDPGKYHYFAIQTRLGLLVCEEAYDRSENYPST